MAQQRRFDSRNTRRKNHKPPAARRYHCEMLEDRVLLSAGPLDNGLPGLSVEAGRYSASEVLVRFRPDVQPTALGEAVGDVGRLGGRPALVPGLHTVTLNDGVDVQQALAAFRASPLVLYAEPNYQVHVTAPVFPNDPSFSSLWGLNNTGQTGGTFDADIDAPEAWELSTGSGNTIVAVIDTGVDYNHPDLAANIWTNPGEIPGNGLDDDGNGFVDDVHGYDFVNNDGDPMDDQGHGTHVSGTIGAVGNNGIGVTGINWHVQIMAVKFIDASGSGSIDDAIEALGYAVANGAKISNNSWGYNGTFSQALYDAVAAARDADHVFVTAAGNGDIFGIGMDNDTNPFWPGNVDLDNVVVVAATDHDDALAFFSNYGATTVDLSAPGVDILSTTPNGTYSYLQGTSMATPHVAGAVALMRDVHPDWDYLTVIDRLFATVDPIAALDGITTTGGRLNLGAALVPDTTGPSVAAVTPDGVTDDPMSSIRITFSEPIDASTFTTADIVSFTGPSGAISVTGVVPVAGSNGRRFDVTFPLQTQLGDYSLTLGPQILDKSGNLMDQDGDGVGGETPDDQFTTTVTMVSFAARFDFGTAATILTDPSPIAEGYTGIEPADTYSAAVGYGWGPGTVLAVDRGIGTDLTRDLNYYRDVTFLVDVPNGTYDVTVTMGDTGWNHDLMGVFLEGVQVDSVTTATGEVVTITYSNVNVSDGQLTVRLDDLGGSDENVVINALQVVWTGPDAVGPRVVSAGPAGTVMAPLDRMTVTFSEAVDPATFTTADVTLSGPVGLFAATAVHALSGTQFEVVFPAQSALGGYQMTVGPNIADPDGNLMDQDADGLLGETPDDQFTHALTLVSFAAQFDFGTASSPVQAGYTKVTPSNTYNATAGFGWGPGTVLAVDRGTGTDLTRDLNYYRDVTFLLDVPNGTYDVTLTIGDTGWFHDQMGVFLEGNQVDSVTTATGEVRTITYTGVGVSDGQLTLFLHDLGGSDENVVINALTVLSGAPRILASDPAGGLLGPVDHVTVTFSEAIQDGTFTLADVLSLTGPAGAITPSDVNKLTNTQYEVVFPAQSSQGDYQLVIGPDIADLDGQLIDQDGDGTPGEPLDDQFTGSFSIVPFAARFDFGTTTSPVASGYTGVASTDAYNVITGYGWAPGTVLAVDRGTGTAITRDLNYYRDVTFLTDVPNGTYDVTVTIGDTGWYHDQMGVFLEGTQVDTVSTATGQIVTATYHDVTVNDGQLTLLLDDLGGSDENVVINALEIIWTGPDTAGPRVIASSPTGNLTTGQVDRITLTFDEPPAAGTFTLADVVDLSGPNGPIAASAVNPLTATQYEVVFPAQNTPGTYSLTVGPDITDSAGNLMNQDGDGTNGETIQDRFTNTFNIIPFTAKFDFGTNTSPVAAGYTKVVPSNAYSSGLGYGWAPGTVLAVDRATGTALDRDLDYSHALTFLVDAPAGSYDVTVTIGDYGWFHDQMGVFLEGAQVDAVSTSTGQIRTITYAGIDVTDGQLTLLLSDLGGSDENVVINALQLNWVAPASSATATAKGASKSGGGKAARSTSVEAYSPLEPAEFHAIDQNLLDALPPQFWQQPVAPMVGPAQPPRSSAIGEDETAYPDLVDLALPDFEKAEILLLSAAV